jgi:hypothetical protein
MSQEGLQSRIRQWRCKNKKKRQSLTSSFYPQFPPSPLCSHRVRGGKAEEMKNVAAQFNNAALQYAVYNKPQNTILEWDGHRNDLAILYWRSLAFGIPNISYYYA